MRRPEAVVADGASTSRAMDAARLRGRLNPMVIGAAASVMIAGLVGVGALTGLIPGARSPDGAAGASAGGGPSEQRTPEAERPPLAASPASCASCGVVQSIHAVEVEVDATGVGTEAGSAAGNELGLGRGSAVTAAAGAAGGALAGNEGDKEPRKRVAYRVTLRMDDGSYRTFSQPTPPAVAIGNRVQIVDGAVVPQFDGIAMKR